MVVDNGLTRKEVETILGPRMMGWENGKVTYYEEEGEGPFKRIDATQLTASQLTRGAVRRSASKVLFSVLANSNPLPIGMIDGQALALVPETDLVTETKELLRPQSTIKPPVAVDDKVWLKNLKGRPVQMTVRAISGFYATVVHNNNDQPILVPLNALLREPDAEADAVVTDPSTGKKSVLRDWTKGRRRTPTQLKLSLMQTTLCLHLWLVAVAFLNQKCIL